MKEEDFNFNPVEPGIWKHENEGDAIFGVLINTEPKDEANDLSAKYYIETVTGMMMVWGSAVLDDRMKLVKLGTPVRITYMGKKQNAKVETSSVHCRDREKEADSTNGDTINTDRGGGRKKTIIFFYIQNPE